MNRKAEKSFKNICELLKEENKNAKTRSYRNLSASKVHSWFFQTQPSHHPSSGAIGSYRSILSILLLKRLFRSTFATTVTSFLGTWGGFQRKMLTIVWDELQLFEERGRRSLLAAGARPWGNFKLSPSKKNEPHLKSDWGWGWRSLVEKISTMNILNII